MDHIDRHLATAASNSNFDPAIQAALALGKKVLNKYYSLTDHSELYRIAMGVYSVLISAAYYLLTHPLSSSPSQSQAGLLQSC